ncbi:MAG TPA: adventurous gliding motility protein CglF [Anaeromyxobacteraceae bacterium]|nr:adventurous gliding motility protein CglF [Anaeromyxobacteraceae bacterium]
MRTLALLTLLAIPLVPSAEDTAEQKPKVVYEKRTEINFEDDTIDGDLKRPDGEYVEARRKVSHSNLIRIREDWREKVMQASGEL